MFKGDGRGCWWSQGKITTFSFVVREKVRVLRASGYGIYYIFLKKSGRNFSEMPYEPCFLQLTKFAAIKLIVATRITNISNSPSFKLGSHHGDHICRLGRQNLFASDSSPKVCRQSIPTNCPLSVLSSSPFIRWVFLKFSA